MSGRGFSLLARLGGIARVVWDNGGQIGVLKEEDILAAHAIYQASMDSEARGKGKGARGGRSIKWEQFMPVVDRNIAGVIGPDWLVIGEDA